MNIYQRLNEVRKAVAYIRKEKEVTGAGTYKVVTHDQVTGEIRESLIVHGIMIVPRLIKSVTVDTRTTTAKGIPIIRYEAFYEIDFVNCEEPSDKVTVSIESHALDQGDKAPGKAISYATKYAMLKLLSIETGDEEEDRPEVKAAKPTSGVEERVSKEDQEKAWHVINSVVDCLNAELPEEAARVLMESDKTLDADGKVYLWKQLDSKQRSLLKKTMADMKKQPEAA